MFESILNYLDHFTREILAIQVGLLFVVFSFLIWIWFYNKKKYNNLKHQIPATVVKGYIDSIITNSDALKSSIFRGGGLDVDPSKIPSVMPLQGLASGGAGSEDLSAKLAEIAQLRSQLSEKENALKDIENEHTGTKGELTSAKERIEELEKQLAAGGGGDGASSAELGLVTKERDELKQRIQEYAIIEDDLANLKRLQQENEQLKKALAEGGGSVATSAPEPAAQAAPAPEPEASADPEPVAATQADEDTAPDMAAAAQDPDNKSPDDLLSEFEKMLG